MTGNVTWWTFKQTYSASEKNSVSSVSAYVCPTRRSGGSNYAENPDSECLSNNDTHCGPLSDYAVAGSFGLPTADANIPAEVAAWEAGNSGWSQGIAGNTTPNVGQMKGPIRPASCTYTNDDFWNISSWTPRDTFAIMTDGTSNQFLIGEKHLPISQIGKCYGWNNSVGGQTGHEYFTGYDCGYQYISDNAQEFSMFRNIHAQSLPIGSGNDYLNAMGGPFVYALTNYHFGSPHTGVCNFVLGDGSVHGVSSTTPVRILASYANTSDGRSVSIP